MNSELVPAMSRMVCQFSCGAASAVAAKLSLARWGATHEIVLVNAFIAEEHPDNRRFLADCERWLQTPITVLQNEKYGASTDEVWRRRRFLGGAKFGAPCSRELKREVLDAWRRADDVMVLGYTCEEVARWNRWIDANPTLRAEAPLIDAGLSKSDCLAMIDRAGIALPAMYLLGFQNANCIGCPKGGEGYWNMIRRHFPERFEAVARIQDLLGAGSYIFRDRHTGERYSLRDLPPGKGRYKDEPDISCSFFCEMAERDIHNQHAADDRVGGDSQPYLIGVDLGRAEI